MQDFTKLLAWQRGRQLAAQIRHSFTPARCKCVPGMRSQAIRAASGVPRNLAEGCGKPSALELARYADIACGSLSELRSQLIEAFDADVVSRSRFEELDKEIDELRAMLVGLARSVRSRNRERGTDTNSN